MNTDEVQEIVQKQWPDFLQVLKQMMSVPSVQGEPGPHAPFGTDPRRALTLVTQLGQQYGFKTGIVQNAMAYVQWGEDDNDYIGVVGHLDVVPAGDGWDYPPFSLTRDAERLFGRGILDNKGASMACLYGLKILKDAGITLPRTIRLIFGSNEESGSQDIPLYLEQENAPTFGFTPDCKFPVVYGERGIVNYAIHTNLSSETLAQISELQGFQAKDHIPDQLSWIVDNQVLKVQGKRTPTNAPELGENAILLLAKRVTQSQLGTAELQTYCQWLRDCFEEKYYGEGLNMAFADPDSGKLIVSPYLLQKTDTGFVLEISIRYPVTFQEAQITARLNTTLFSNSRAIIIRSMPGILHDRQDPFIECLSKVYSDMTGLNSTPVTTTGATYARSMPNIVAFGPSFPGQKGIAHKQNEWMDEKDLMMNMAIYTQALYALGNMKG